MATRILGPTGGARKKRLGLVLGSFAGSILLLLGVPAALGSHGEASLAGSNFEIDTNANLKVDDPAPSIDWSGVTETRNADTTSGANDESFGQGSKEDTAEPSVVDGSIPPNKSDLKFFGVYQEGTSNAGFLNMYWSRVQDPSGTTNMDFEFNKRQCTPGLTPADPDCSSNGLTPLRSIGDLLVIYDLAQGGTVPILSIREWTGTEWGTPTDLSASNKAAGSINAAAIAAPDADLLGSHSARTFGEAQIAMSAIFPSGSGCQSFGSAYLKSRSSDSFTAALKDFVPPVAVNITNCGRINIHKQDDSGSALANVTFTLYNDIAPTGGTRGAEDTATSTTCTTDSAGNCSMLAVPFGRYWVVEGTPPSGYTAAADQNVNLTSANATVNLTFVDNRQPATVRILKQDDAATPNPLASVRFTLWVDNSPTGPPDGTGSNQDQHGSEDTATALFCDTNASGTCEITGIVTPGKYWIVEGTPPAGYVAAPDQWVEISLGGVYPSATGRFTFTDPRKFKVIVLVCKKGATAAQDTLYSAKVGFDTTTPPSTTTSPGPGGGGTTTDATLCALGGAVHDNVQKAHTGGGDHSAVIKIE